MSPTIGKKNFSSANPFGSIKLIYYVDELNSSTPQTRQARKKQYLVMGLEYLYDDSGIRVIVLDREYPT